MRVACVQYEPILEKVKENMQCVNDMLASFSPNELDLIVLPEMAFTGYVFRNRSHIEPFMEEEQGPTFKWCQEQAKRLNAFVAAGFPWKHEGKYLNAMCLVSNEGVLLKTYAKHFLYSTDKTWADAGPGFTSMYIDKLERQIGLAICMDVNPYEYIDSSLFEFAHFHKENKSTLLIFLANWIDSNPKTDDPIDTQQYWAYRLKPLIGSDAYFIVSNRIGTEEGTTFCGGSCVLSLKEPRLVATLNKRQTGVLIVNIK